MEDTQGRKHDHTKLDWTLLPWEQLERVARVCHNGAAKYSALNWRKVKNGGRRYMAAALRHIAAHLKGELYDSEWGFPHLAHAVCSLLYCMHFQNYDLEDKHVQELTEAKYDGDETSTCS